MMAWEIFRFEIGYHARRPSTWIALAVSFALTFYLAGELSSEFARLDGSFANAPHTIAVLSLLGGVIGLLFATAIAGDAAARDPQTRMAPLFYTTPIDKTAYLGGRFLAAFALYASMLALVPVALLLAASRMPAELLGPPRSAAYAGPYLLLLLPNAFVATALVFSGAALTRRAVGSYAGGLLLFGASASGWALARTFGYWELGKLLDPLGAATLDELSRVWTPFQRSHQLIEPARLLSNRLLWLAIAMGVLAVAYWRVRLTHHPIGDTATRGTRAAERTRDHAAPGDSAGAAAIGRAARHLTSVSGAGTRAHQVFAVAGESFISVVKGWGGLAIAGTAAFLAFSGLPIAHMDVPLAATTERVLSFLATPLARPQEINGVIVPLLIIFFAGELIWREREASIHEIADAAPAPDWALFVGKFAGLGLVLILLQALMIGAGIITQVLLRHYHFEIGLYARTLLGLQLVDALLFALLALGVHALVNQKYVGHLLLVAAYLFMVLAPALGVGHNLLIYGGDSGWTYSDMRGFDPFIAAWLWFKLYWIAWTCVLAFVVTRLWVRGRDEGFRSRIARARRRLTPLSAAIAAVAMTIVMAAGSVIFYNTNILNTYRTPDDAAAWAAEYERRYGQYRDTPQPRLTGVALNVEIHPERREVDIRGTYDLVNKGAAPIDAVHVAMSTNANVETGTIAFDRPARATASEDRSGQRIYALDRALRPGESLRLQFETRFAPRGFPNRAIDDAVAANGTYFTTAAWLPAIGYQVERELADRVTRRLHGLPDRPMPARLDDARARDPGTAAPVAFEAIVGVPGDQIAVAPGRLRRTWTRDGRRYLHYAADTPITNDIGIFSAAYATRHARWNDVSLQVAFHPAHAWNVDRMIHGMRASLDRLTQRFGPYPHRDLRMVEHPGGSIVLHAHPVSIAYDEGFSLMRPEDDPRAIDFPFAIVAHEVAHQWWGHVLRPARVAGAALLTETLAWYSALDVVEATFGPDHLSRLLERMREVYLAPSSRAHPPLLYAADWFLAYRKGPLAMYALREYIGDEPVHQALRRLLARHAAADAPLPTSLDLYRELQAATPDAHRPLLADLFERNTYWQLATRTASAERIGGDDWRVTLAVDARKVTVDPGGVETEVAMDDEVEIGVFAAAADGGPGAPLYRQRHRVRAGTQQIAVTVRGTPASAGIDPRRLLIDLDGTDNVAPVAITGPGTDRSRSARARARDPRTS